MSIARKIESLYGAIGRFKQKFMVIILSQTTWFVVTFIGHNII